MKRPYKLSKGELKHRAMLRSMGIKPLPRPPKQKPSLPGQVELFEGLGDEDEPTDTTAPEDSQ